MKSKTHSGGHRPVFAAVGGEALHATRKPRPHYRLARQVPLSWRGAVRGPALSRHRPGPTLFAPVLHQTRRSPAGPKHQHRQEQAVAGSGRIHGPRMLMNGENLFHVPSPTQQRA